MRRVTFFTRPECTLCRGALFVIQRVRQRFDFHLQIVDISAAGNERWHEAYKHDIPVVLIDDEEVFRHRVDERRFAELVGPAGAGGVSAP